SWFFSLTLAFVACGGKVVVDQPSPSGGAGTGGSAGGTPSGTTVNGTTTGDETTGGETTGGETTGGTSGVGGSATTGPSGETVTAGTGPGGCGESCSGMEFFCTCSATCQGLNLEADCKTDPNGQSSCNCLINGQFVGGCGGPSQGIACDVFGGCCADFFPEQGG